MNKYELAVVFKVNLDEEAFKAEFEKVQGLVTRFGGTIDKIDEWGKRRLAYEVNKATEGVYEFIHFTSESTAPAEIESRLRIDEHILRYLITRQDA